MKGFIVGYITSWSDDRYPNIVGLYTNIESAKNIAEILEIENVEKYKRLRRVYIVEIQTDKTYNVENSLADWIMNYPHQIVYTKNGKIMYEKNEQPVFQESGNNYTGEWKEKKTRKKKKRKGLY